VDEVAPEQMVLRIQSVLLLRARIDCKSMDELLNVICITRTFAYACPLLRNFADRCGAIRLDDGPDFSFSDPNFYYVIFKKATFDNKETVVLQQN
jgi:hypothetical protein